jgi:glycosyltransferase involved in cell wall biosynthesis
VRVAFLTVGDPARLTGGYLYHREVFARLRGRGLLIDEIVAAEAGLEAQLAASQHFVQGFDPDLYDAVVVDALARAVCAPGNDRWREHRPLVAMVHELPSVAAGREAGASEIERERAFEASLLRADQMIAVSDDGRRILVERGVPAERVVVASGGFDRLTAGDGQRATDHGRGTTVLCVAQWIPRKGVLELARAWALAARPGWRLELVGETTADSAYAAAVREVIAAAPEGSIVVRGALSDDELAEAFAGASVFAMPSRYEGYGIAYAEALAAGLPVVGCAVGPVPELVGPEAGLLVPAGDTGALAAALARLIDDRPLRERMSRAARRRAAELPTWGDTAERFLYAIQQAITAR